MPKFKTFDASVEVDGEDLPELDVKIDEQEKQVSCWIPSEAGKNFFVCWHNSKPTMDTSGSVVLDGAKVGGKVTRKGYVKKVKRGCKRVSPTTARHFSFSPIIYTDDDTYLNTTTDVGEIKLIITRVKIQGRSTRNNWTDPLESHTLQVHERSKKLGAHCVLFGDKQSTPSTKRIKTKDLEILATFIFRFRPLDILQANGIAPRLPQVQPTAEGSKTKVSNVKDEGSDSDSETGRRLEAQLEEAIRLVKEHRNKKRKVKAEKMDDSIKDKDNNLKKRKFKAERVDHPIIQNEVIDLT